MDERDSGNDPQRLGLLASAVAGRNVADIASELFLSPGTVRNYLAAVVTKLNARNRVHAIRIATDAEWL